MANNKLNIYNNLIKLTRNKNFYLKLEQNETFSDRLIILFFHFGFFLKNYKDVISKKESQDIFDFFMRQIELSIREIGYGDASINKKMKTYVNSLYSILEKIENWDSLKTDDKNQILKSFFNYDGDLNKLINYFDKYSIFLKKNSFNSFLNSVLNLKI